MNFSIYFELVGENTVSTLGRVVLVIWLFVVLIIQSSYTASLTSFLTVQQLTSSIKGIDSLITGNQQIGFQIGSYAENYLNEELNIPKSRLKPLESAEDYANALSTGRVAAVVDEQPYIDLFLSNYCQFAIAGQEFTKSGWGFVSISNRDVYIVNCFSFINKCPGISVLNSHFKLASGYVLLYSHFAPFSLSGGGAKIDKFF